MTDRDPLQALYESVLISHLSRRIVRRELSVTGNSSLDSRPGFEGAISIYAVKE
jgi:hypothetical protein